MNESIFRDPWMAMFEMAEGALNTRRSLMNLLITHGDELAASDSASVRQALWSLGAAHLLSDDNQTGPFQGSVRQIVIHRMEELGLKDPSPEPEPEPEGTEQEQQRALEAGKRRAVAKTLAAAMGCDWEVVPTSLESNLVRITAPDGYTFSRDYLTQKTWTFSPKDPDWWSTVRKYLLWGLTEKLQGPPEPQEDAATDKKALADRAREKAEQTALGLGCRLETTSIDEGEADEVTITAPAGRVFVHTAIEGSHTLLWNIGRTQAHLWRQLQIELAEGLKECTDPECQDCGERYESLVRERADHVSATITTEDKKEGLGVWIWAPTGYVWKAAGRSHYLHRTICDSMPRAWADFLGDFVQGLSRCKAIGACGACQRAAEKAGGADLRAVAHGAEPAGADTTATTWKKTALGPEEFEPIETDERAELEATVERYGGRVEVRDDIIRIFAPHQFRWSSGARHKFATDHDTSRWALLLKRVSEGVRLCWQYPDCELCEENLDATRQ